MSTRTAVEVEHLRPGAKVNQILLPYPVWHGVEVIVLIEYVATAAMCTMLEGVVAVTLK